MKTLLWILNSGMLLLLGLIGLFSFLSDPKIPRKESIQPSHSAAVLADQDSSVVIDPSIIYENDLFGTYHKPTATGEPKEIVIVAPQPPTPTPVIVPKEPKTDITLTWDANK